MVWNPWNELNDVENTLARAFGLTNEFRPQNDYPPVNVWSGENEIRLSILLPGVKSEELDINIKHDTLSVKCQRAVEALPEGSHALRQERINGRWVRNFALPFHVEGYDVEATYKDGILTIRLPKAKAEQPRKIAIQGC